MIIALLMGRKKSKGFPGKNLYRVLGRALAYYPMRAAKACPEIDMAYISTDDEALMELAEKNGINIIQRPPELCTDEALGEDVYLHAYNFVKNENYAHKIEMLVLLMCNAPTVTPEVISTGIKVLRGKGTKDIGLVKPVLTRTPFTYNSGCLLSYTTAMCVHPIIAASYTSNAGK